MEESEFCVPFYICQCVRKKEIESYDACNGERTPFIAIFAIDITLWIALAFIFGILAIASNSM